MVFKTTLLLFGFIAIFTGLITAQRPDNQRRRAAPTFEMIAERFDANKDGKVTREEAGGRERMFNRFDTNKDGVITKSDLANISSRQGRRRRGGGGGRGGMFGSFPNAKPAPGQIAPNFDLSTPDGETVSLGKLLYEKPVVLEFGSFT